MCGRRVRTGRRAGRRSAGLEARRELFDALEALPAPTEPGASPPRALRDAVRRDLGGHGADRGRCRDDGLPRSSCGLICSLQPWSARPRGSRQLLERFVAGKLTRQERQALQAHLVRCEECAALGGCTPGSTAAAPPARLAPLDPERPPTCGGDAPVVPRPRPRRGRALPRRARGRRERWAGSRSTGAPTGGRCLDERCLRPAGTRRARARCGDADAAGSSVDDRTGAAADALRAAAPDPTWNDRHDWVPPERPARAGTRRHTDPAVGVARAGDRHRGNDACYGLAASRGGAPRRNVASHRCP